jgi:hypothetical protein
MRRSITASIMGPIIDFFFIMGLDFIILMRSPPILSLTYASHGIFFGEILEVLKYSVWIGHFFFWHAVVWMSVYRVTVSLLNLDD